MNKDELKKKLHEAIDRIEDYDLLDTIAQKVEEEAAVYKKTKPQTEWDKLPQWQKEEIDLGAQQIENGEFEEHRTVMKKLRALK